MLAPLAIVEGVEPSSVVLEAALIPNRTTISCLSKESHLLTDVRSVEPDLSRETWSDPREFNPAFRQEYCRLHTVLVPIS